MCPPSINQKCLTPLVLLCSQRSTRRQGGTRLRPVRSIISSVQRIVILLPAALVVFVAASAQAPAPPPAAQNPSPMVEHTRAHPRLEKQSLAGQREALELGTLFVAEKLRGRKQLPLLVFFHGGTWLPEVAAARHRAAAILIQIGAGSGVYARAFADPSRFLALVQEAERKAGVRFARITVGGWSAGCAAIREISKSPEAYARVANFLCIDGIHTGYVGGQPGPQESQLELPNVEAYLPMMRDAVAGRKRVVITHSEIFPGTFASTTETADWLLAQLGVRRRPVLRWGPMGTQQLSEARQRGLLVVGFAGNSAPDHVDQLHSLPEYLKWFK